MKKLILFSILLLFFTGTVLAENTVNLYFFYGQGCPHCGSEKQFLSQMEEKYPTLNIKEYEVYQNNQNRELFQECSSLAGTSIQGVPTTFIDRKAHIGFSDEIAEDIESEIQRCLEEDCKGMMTQNNTEVCDTENPSYNKEEIVGYVLLGIIAALIIFFIIKKSFFNTKNKNKKKRK